MATAPGIGNLPSLRVGMATVVDRTVPDKLVPFRLHLRVLLRHFRL